MDILGQTPTQLILFFTLYGITGVVPLIAAIYLLLRKGNAFASDVTPPMRLRRWAASFFAIAALGHVWWYIFYIYFGDIHSVPYFVVVMLDCVSLLITIAGTLLAMLQDRRRSVRPAIVAMIPFVALCGVLMIHPSKLIELISGAYILLLYVIFTAYMVVAVKRYGQWLNDNYADLENKKVWLSQVVTLGCMLLFILYLIVSNMVIVFFLHFTELVLFCLLIWRVETLPQLDSISTEVTCSASAPETTQEIGLPLTSETTQEIGSPVPTEMTLKAQAIQANIGQLLTTKCEETRLYLQHDLTLAQLSAAVGVNRTYLSQYFSSLGMNYNTYINSLRIKHFIRLYRETVANLRPFTAQQLAQESGYRSYSTFSSAFKQRMGQSVTVWMNDTDK